MQQLLLIRTFLWGRAWTFMLRTLGRKLRWRRKPAFLKTSLWLQHAVERVTRGRVCQGPFAGMLLEFEDPSPNYMPQLLGTYEMELYPLIEEQLRQPYDLIVNAGSSVGYFAVGLAMRSGKKIVAYEADASCHPMLASLAGLNGVAELIEQRGLCDTGDLQALLETAGKPLIFIDIEGAEELVLSLAAVPALGNSALIVETHDFLVPGITDRLAESFAATHEVDRVLTCKRSLRDLPGAVPLLLRPLLGSAMREHRGTEQTWLVLLPR